MGARVSMATASRFSYQNAPWGDPARTRLLEQARSDAEARIEQFQAQLHDLEQRETDEVVENAQLLSGSWRNVTAREKSDQLRKSIADERSRVEAIDEELAAAAEAEKAQETEAERVQRLQQRRDELQHELHNYDLISEPNEGTAATIAELHGELQSVESELSEIEKARTDREAEAQAEQRREADRQRKREQRALERIPDAAQAFVHQRAQLAQRHAEVRDAVLNLAVEYFEVKSTTIEAQKQLEQYMADAYGRDRKWAEPIRRLLTHLVETNDTDIEHRDLTDDERNVINAFVKDVIGRPFQNNWNSFQETRDFLGSCPNVEDWETTSG